MRSPQPGLPSLLGPVPPLPVLVGLQVGIFLAAVAGLVGFRTRAACVSFSVLLLVHHSIEYSFGKIDHDLLGIVMVLVFSTSGWGAAYSLDAATRRGARETHWGERNSRAVAVFLAVLAVAFFTAAFAKIQGGWLDPSTQMAGNWIQLYRVVQPNEALLAGASAAAPAFVLEFVDISTIVIELAPLLLLVKPAWARRVPFALVLFHIGVLLAMGINFALLLVLYIPIAAEPTAGRRLAGLAARLTATR